jgi:hypothetical protein
MRRQPRRSQKPRIRLIDSLIDALMTQPHRWIFGKAQTQMTADLLRAPTLTEQFGNHGAEVIVGIESALMVTCSTRGGAPVGVEGLVAAPGRGVAAQLPRNRRRCSAETVGDRAHTQPRTAQTGDLDAFLLG